MNTKRINENKHGAGIALLASLALLLAGCGDGGTPADAEASGAPETATTSVTPVNGAPKIEGTPPEDVEVAASYVFEPVASDPDGDPLVFSAQGLPEWATLDAATGKVTGSPAADDAGESASIEISVTDGQNVTALAPFKIRIAPRPAAAPSVPGNTAPSISGAPVATAQAGKAWSFTPAATDPDTLKLTFKIANKPSWASFSSATGALSGTPASKNVGSYPDIVISVTDGAQSAALPAFTLEVKPAPNGAPTIGGTPATSVVANSTYGFTPQASDPEKQALGFSISNKPVWASFNTASGSLTGTPTQAQVGTFSNIVISVSDGTTKTSLAAFSITVTAPAGGAPTISGQPATSVKAGSAYSFKPTASDPNGDKLTFSVSNKPAWASFDTATGQLAGTAPVDGTGTYGNIVISASDGKLSASLQPFSILVTATTMGSAALSWTAPTQNTDGSQLNNLGGYRIYFGKSADQLDSTIQVTNPGLTSYTVGNLSAGTYYFAVAAYTTDGVEGARSGVGSKTIL